MRWMDARKAALLGPMMFVMCGDSLAPGCGRTSPTPEHGAFACTMRIGGEEVPCAGEWWHWTTSDGREIHVSGNAGAGGARAGIYLRLPRGATPGELRSGIYPSPDANAVTSSGAYCASAACEGSTGTLVLTALDPPRGRFDGTLTPLKGSGQAPGPPGTTVTLEVTF